MQRICTTLFLFIGINISFCQDNRIEEPIKNFDELWNVFNNRYANFELKNIDWNQVYKKYRPLINEQTTNDSLFKVCNDMLLELKDGHVNLLQYGNQGKIIKKGDDGSPSNFLKNFPISKEEKYNIFQLIETTDKTLKTHGFSNSISSEKGTIEYSISKNYGYLRILSMGNLSLSKYKKHINNAIKSFRNKNGVIIDVRFNGGGDDKVAFTIANKFTDKKRIGHYKRERKKGTTEFKKTETRYLEPYGDEQFTNHIVVLTSDLTASAAEVFTMIMKALPYVTIIGDNTNGIFSDMYDFKLPNKWKVTLSHQQYFSGEMKNYEGSGIEPDFKLLNKPEDILKGIDPLINSGIKLLNEKNNR